MPAETHVQLPSEGVPTDGRWLLGVLFLAPLALLAWPGPGALLAADPFPHLAGTAWAALASVPAAVVLLVRVRGALPFATLLAFAWLAALLVLQASGVTTDVLEAHRALFQATILVFAFVAGSRLGRTELRLFECGLMIASLAWTVQALLDQWTGVSPGAGVLGDSGSLSQAALPGALVGALFFARGSGGVRALGLTTFILFALHALQVPVLAGAVAALLALGSALVLESGATRRRCALVFGALLLGLFTLATGLVHSSGGSAPNATAGLDRVEPEAATGVASTTDATRRSPFGGFEVRARIWSRIPALIAARPGGIGPGQFQASFPPFRDPREIQLSRQGVCNDFETEVEHAHNDWLGGLAEGGAPGGLLWFALLAWIGARAWRRLAGGTIEVAAAALAVLGLLWNAALHSAVLVHPTNGLVFGLLAGVLFQGGRALRAIPAALGVRLAALGLVVVAVLAWPLTTHGRALTTYVGALARLDREPNASEARRESLARTARESLARALVAAPASVPARKQSARLTNELEPWFELLDLRPWAADVHDQLATLAARRGQDELAREHWETSLSLSADHPRLLRNLARLAAWSERPSEAATWIARLEANGCLQANWLRELGASLALAGRRDAALDAFTRADPELAGGPEALFAASGAAREAGDKRLADALRSLAHQGWARRHAAAGDFATAVRSYRQALAPTLVAKSSGSPAIRLEKAAAEWRAGLPDEAARTLREGGGASVLEADNGGLDWVRSCFSELSALAARR